MGTVRSETKRWIVSGRLEIQNGTRLIDVCERRTRKGPEVSSANCSCSGETVNAKAALSDFEFFIY